MNQTESLKLLAKAEQLIPACSQTYSKGPTYHVRGVSPVFLESGNGCYVTDIDGNTYCDYICALGPVTLGYNYPRVNEAIRKQLDKGIIFSLPHRLEIELAELLREIIPCCEKMRLSKTGSEVCAAAVKAARAYTGREHIVYWGYCYSDDTEILTKDGFKLFKNLKGREIVATLNQETHDIEYHPINEKIEYDYEGEMIHFTGRRTDLLVTPNHKIYRRYTRQNGTTYYKLCKAVEVKKTRIKMFAGGKWEGEKIESFTIPSLPLDLPSRRIPKPHFHNRTKGVISFPIKPFLRFLGWYVTEGHYTIEPRGKYEVGISQMNPKYIDEIVQTIKELGFKPGRRGHHITFSSKELTLYLSKLGKCKEKHIPEWVKQLTPDLLKEFIDAAIKGDGTTDGTRRKFYSTSKHLIDDMQEILLKTGFATTVTTVINNTGRFRRQYTVPSIIYHLSISPRISKTTIAQKQQYNGKIYCVNVKNHLIFVRRNGKTAWSSNSGWHDWYSCISDRPAGIPAVYKTFMHTFKYNDLTSLENALQTFNPAAVIMEPMGVVFPARGFLEGVRSLCTKYGTVLIFDEMITGFRLDLHGAQGYFGVTPDLATFGKGMANGMPIATLVGKKEIMDVFDIENKAFFSTTFGGETLSIAAAIATIKEMQEKQTIEHVRRVGSKLMIGLNGIKGISATGYPARILPVLENEDIEKKSLLTQEMAKRGFLILINGLNLCYSHTEQDIDKALIALEEVVSLINANKVKLEGLPIRPMFKRL